MNRRRLFCIFIFCLVLVGCKNNEYENQFNIVGDWYACQYWGEEKREEIDVYESESGTIRNIEHPEKTQTKHWDNSYNYGENIISFNTTVQRNFPIRSTDHHRSHSEDVWA